MEYPSLSVCSSRLLDRFELVERDLTSQNFQVKSIKKEKLLNYFSLSLDLVILHLQHLKQTDPSWFSSFRRIISDKISEIKMLQD
ncbi:hypothetical protein BpHYR1_007590 [Brachionus plicatilis]|uniref:Uncharacterized protein n=1 Tax=Brachionus plicatilis TaxID=10195 RepID=A0A3M7R174_BRAPC|nr:hypothetical protein BpHYR1_007590 [Brachionus plicatilis]